MAPPLHQIRADFNRDTIVVYQAFSKHIAVPAVSKNKFQPPFSLTRMTWIKPSLLWLMARSNWGQKSGQEYILQIRITRVGWEKALSEAVLTSPEKGVYRDGDQWRTLFEKARIHVQWDPERSLRGKKLEHRSIQVGISRHLIRQYVDEWIVSITNYTPVVRKIHKLCQEGKHSNAQKLLPNERPYPLPSEIGSKIGISG